ncbi:diphthine--ammonia ligase [Methanolapillus ohkumae]|uniref:Diphthamide synthase domain-containing protein n=1 Tax=Methanolapillus ohkumae TaxID=3028298 RepID=A0AA96ZX02_9EURY|nr:hypothetical protein MsAm2_09470 [Methanosarcinaceae archaeon Am2]
MRLGALVSGGKDSVFAVWKMLAAGHDVVCLICLVPKNKESYMFHSINMGLVQDISDASGIPLLYQSTNGVKEKELDDLKSALMDAKSKYGISGICSGAIESEYQKKRVDDACRKCDLQSFSPLWKFDPETLISEMIHSGMEIIFAAVAADGLDEKWLGRQLNADALLDLKRLHELKYVHIAGEGGEFETAVLDAPFFKKKIVPVNTKKYWLKNRGCFRILETRLDDKP